MGKAFGYYVGEVVTKDHLDARLGQVEAKIDSRLEEIRATSRMHNWIFAMLAAAILIPTLKDLFIP